MKRTINFTERTTIFHEDARISLARHSDGACTFDASLNLSEYGLPYDANLYIEAYRQTRWMRFAWGTVGEPLAAADRVLREFDSPDDILFRVKVVAKEPPGRLVAEADRISPSAPGAGTDMRAPLLPVKAEDLGEEIWKVEIESPSTRLLVNRSLGDVHSVALSPHFRAYVYPAALRLILMEALCDRTADGELPTAGEPDEWQSKWLRFCQHLPGIGDAIDPFSLEDREERVRWIDGAVRAFCRRLCLRDQFGALSREGELP